MEEKNNEKLNVQDDDIIKDRALSSGRDPTNKDPTEKEQSAPQEDVEGKIKDLKKDIKSKNKKLDKMHKKKAKKEKDFTPHDLQELMEKLDKKESGILRSITTKRFTKKISRDIIVTRLITISMILILLTMGVGYSLSYTYVNSGYGINVITDQQITKAISLSEDDNFERLSVGLKASAIVEMDNITYEWFWLNDWLPEDPAEFTGGNHNGENFIAYTFYVLNTGNADLDYNSSLRIKHSTQEVEAAIRVMIYRNNIPTVYTHTYEEQIDSVIDGEAYTDENQNGIWDEGEPYTDENANGSYDGGVKVEEFESENIITSSISTLPMNDFDKYTVVIWLEGEDNDCNNDKFSSELQLVWNVSVIEDEI